MYCKTIAILVALACAASAQNPPTAALSGSVLDSTQSGVSGAKASLLKNDGSAVSATTADVNGTFQFTAIAPGNYRVVVEHDGFDPANVPVKLIGRTPLQIVVHLNIAALRSEVNVSAQSPELSTETADNRDTATLTGQAMDDLPIFDQDYIGTMSRFLDSGSIATGGVTVIVDGVETDRASVSASAIQEVKINNDPYSAEYPRPGRSRIEIITKPGGSDFHGTFNFFFRDSYLNARDPFSLTRPSGTAPDLRRQSYRAAGPQQEDVVSDFGEPPGGRRAGDGLRARCVRADSGDASNAFAEYRAFRQCEPPDWRGPVDFNSWPVYRSHDPESGRRRIQSAGDGHEF